MSLQIWLPLNGTLKNKGVSDITVENSGATIDSSGKIGSCYSFNGTNQYMKASNISLPTTSWSMCAWLYPMAESPSSHQYIVGLNTSGANDFLGVLAVNGNQLCARIAGTTYYTGVTYTLNTWYHLAAIYDGTLKIYVNGELTQTVSSPVQPVAASTLYICMRGSSGFYFSGKVNDIRIYDTAISTAEVKEIAKGLAVHYKLDNSGVGNPNLVTLTNTGNTNRFGYGEQTGGSTKSVEYDGSIPCIKITRNSTTHSGWAYLWHNGLTTSSIKTSTVYTVSFDAIASGNGSVVFGGFKNGDATNQLSASMTVIKGSFNASNWSHIVLQTTTKSSFDGISVGSQVVYMNCDYMNNTNVWLKIKNFKVEEGSVDTFWLPASTDPKYTRLGYDSTTISDCTGYGNHGTKSGTISVYTDTPRYDLSTVFDGSTSYIDIKSSVFPTVLNGDFTISAWTYNADSGDRSILFGNFGLTGGFFNIEKKTDEKVRFYWNANPDITFDNSILTANQFCFLTITRSGNTVKCYINGVLTDTSTTTLSGSIPSTATNFRIGADNRTGETMFKGRISDFRIYATPLSADDIKRLYEVSASVSKNGAMLGYEIKEE